MSGEQVVRGAIIKQMNQFSYEELAFHVQDSATYRWFCRVGIADAPPPATTWQANIKRLTPETWEAVNRELVGYARDEGIDRADIVIDVGAIYDPALRRFDHHQKSYTGPWSSAGMVLDWLCQQSRIQPGLGAMLQARIVSYVDDVDNGRVEPRSNVPCFAGMVSICGRGCVTLDDFDDAFLRGVDVALLLVAGIVAEHRELAEAETIVREAMDRAVAAGSNLLELPCYVPWKPGYFALGGQTHPTDFVIMPGLDGSWRAVAIPPEEGSFAQKRPLPAAWAGLSDGNLLAASGVAGARFCDKNRFIVILDSRPHLLEALEVGGMLDGKLDG